MLTLEKISSKYDGTVDFRKNNTRPVTATVPDIDDPEWDAYLDNVRHRRDQVLTFLLTEFQKKAQEEPGKCVEYLRTLIVHTYRLSKKSSNARVADESAMMIFRTLFDLANASWSLAPQIMDDMMNIGINAVKDFSSSTLVKYLEENALLELGTEEKVLCSRWVELFVKFVSVLSERGDVPLEGDKVNGSKYRQYIIQDLCRKDWSKPIMKSYLAILEEMTGLDGYDMDVILEKLGSALKTMPSNFVHSCVSQIVQITGNIRPAFTLTTLDEYFLSIQRKAAAGTTKEVPKKIGKKFSKNEKVSLGIVACNFVDACRDCEPLLKEIQKRVKASLYDHSLVMSPFMLSVILGLTSVDYLRAPIIDSMRSTILRSYHEVNLCSSSLWYKEVVNDIQDDIMPCFQYVLKEGSSCMDYMAVGLKDLGVSLLNTNNLQLKYPMTFKKCRELGLFLVTTVVSKNKEHLGMLIKELLKPNSPAHIECLAGCITQCARTVGQRDFQGRISELLHYLPSMSVESASVIIKSLMPALQISPTLLDDLMIVLRKTFWKSIDAGRICVEVMSVLLSNSTVTGNSQLMSSFGTSDDDLILSQYTQGASNSNADWSPLCREILNLAKRFFLLDCKVREQLYLGLHRVARRNPILNDAISGQLYAHMSRYVSDNNGVCHILYGKIFEFTPAEDVKARITDELGFLVQCIGFVYNKSFLTMEKRNESASLSQCKELLNTIIDFICSIDVDQIEVVSSSIIGDSGIDSKDVIRFVKDVICMQTLQICQALIEYIALTTDKVKQRISQIYKKYHDILHYLKNPPVTKKDQERTKSTTKKTKKKAINDDTASIISGASGRSGSDVTSTTTNATKSKRESTLKPPPYFHIINLDSVCQMLRQLYGPRDKMKSLKSMLNNDSFEVMLLATVQAKVEKLRHKESIRERQRSPLDSINSLTCLIETVWERMCSMESSWNDINNGSIEEGTEVVETRLEMINNVLDFFYNEGHSKRVLFFSKYQASTKEGTVADFCANFFDKWQKILHMTTSVYEGSNNKANASLFNILHSVCKLLDASRTGLVQKIQDWCWAYLKDNSKEESKNCDLLEAAVNVFLTCNIKCNKYSYKTKKDAQKLALAVTKTLGSNEDETPDPDRHSWLISEETAPNLLCCLVNYVDKQCGVLTTVLGRLKSHRQYLGNEKSAEIRESCFELIQCLYEVSKPLVSSNFQAGPCIPQILKLVTEFYNVQSSFTEHLLDLTKYSKDVNINSFKKIVKELGLHFKPKIETMIQHIERVQRVKVLEEKTTKKQKKTPKAKNIVTKIQFTKDAKLIPSMVFHMEKFDQLVIALSKKVEVDLLAGIKLSTARDFRIEHRVLKNVADEMDEGSDQAESDMDTSNMPGPSTASSNKRSNLSRRKN